MEVCSSLIKEFLVVNLIAGPGYVTQFLDRTMWITVYVTLGHLGKSSLTGGALTLSIFQVGCLVMDGFLSAPSVFLSQHIPIRNQVKIERRWLRMSFVFVIVLSLVLYGIAFVLEVFIFGLIPFDAGEIWRARLIALFIAPAILFHGFHRILICHCEYRYLVRPIILSYASGTVLNLIGNGSFIRMLCTYLVHLPFKRAFFFLY